MKTKRTLIISGIFIITYVLMKLFLYPYVVKLQNDTLELYTFQYAAIVPVLGKLAIALFTICLLQLAKMLDVSHYSNKLFWIGIAWYVIYAVCAVIYFSGSGLALPGNLIYVLAYSYTNLMWIPAYLVGFGVVKK